MATAFVTQNWQHRELHMRFSSHTMSSASAHAQYYHYTGGG